MTEENSVIYRLSRKPITPEALGVGLPMTVEQLGEKIVPFVPVGSLETQGFQRVWQGEGIGVDAAGIEVPIDNISDTKVDIVITRLSRVGDRERILLDVQQTVTSGDHRVYLGDFPGIGSLIADMARRDGRDDSGG